MCGDIREKAQEYYRIPSILTQKAPEVSRNCAICGFSDSPSLKVEPRLYFKIDLKLIFKNFPPCICRSANTVLRKPPCNDFADHIIAALTPAFFWDFMRRHCAASDFIIQAVVYFFGLCAFWDFSSRYILFRLEYCCAEKGASLCRWIGTNCFAAGEAGSL